MVTTPPQQFCVRWNSYQSNLQNAFPKLLISEHFVDVTLACETEMLKCHKVVLSACSTYFEKLLLDNPCQHPIIFMKDMKFTELQLLVDFMYKGEVNVTQDDLPSLIKSAEALQIRGLCGSDHLLSQHYFGNAVNNTKHNNNKPFHTSTNNDNIKGTSSNDNNINNNTTTTSSSSSPTSSASAGGATSNNNTNVNIKNDLSIKKDEKIADASECGNNPSSSECDSNDGMHVKDEQEYMKEDLGEDDSYYEGDGELMDTEFLEEDGPVNTGDVKTPEFAIANVSCQYDGSPGSATNRRIRRSDEELRRAAECITRGQTFQTVSDQFNIPISTIRFYMARKGILPRRKRGRACSGPSGGGANLSALPVSTSFNSSAGSGNTSPVGPPYHIVHYKLPTLGVSKLK